jgi:hypothetical protein
MTAAIHDEPNATPDSRTDLLERLTLLELMVNEGRRSTERWGWVFILWGVAPLIALYWETHWRHPDLAWAVIMSIAAALTCAISARKHSKQPRPESAIHRTIEAVWSLSGSSIFLYILSAAISKHYDLRSFLATLFILLAIPNAVSAAVLRWRTQFFIAGMWWCAVVLAFFAPMSWQMPIYVCALLIGNIGFGIYLMLIERGYSRG